jgi:hypothetical protein
MLPSTTNLYPNDDYPILKCLLENNKFKLAENYIRENNIHHNEYYCEFIYCMMNSAIYNLNLKLKDFIINRLGWYRHFKYKFYSDSNYGLLSELRDNYYFDEINFIYDNNL